MSATRCGISAKQIERETGVTYKTAWRMFKQIALCLATKERPIGGRNRQVEMDETYYGSEAKGTRGRGTTKAPLSAWCSARTGSRICRCRREADTLNGLIKEHVLPSHSIYGYFPFLQWAERTRYTHERINTAREST